MPDLNHRCLTEFQYEYLQKCLLDESSEIYRQRIKIMLMADEGLNQTTICKKLGCSQPTARFWISIASNGQAHNWKDISLGRPKKFNSEILQRLEQLVNQNPKNVTVPNQTYNYSFCHWTAKYLSKHLKAEFGVEISDRQINRILKEMGLSTRGKSNSVNNNLEKEKSQIKINNLTTSDNSDSQSIWSFNLFNIGDNHD
jgi:transposase